MKSCIGVYYQITVTDKKTGKVIRKTRFRRSKSFLLQFLQLIEVQIMQANVNITKIDGGSSSFPPDTTILDSTSAIGDDTEGILVGTGTTPVDNLDYVMETLIDHGVGGGELSYGAMSKTTTGEVGANVDFILTRTFTNSSGGSISITETGIYTHSGTVDFMYLHDVFTAVPVGNGQVATVTYTLRTTV